MTTPYSSRISTFALKTHVAHWLQFAGAERKVKGDNANHVGFDAADLVGEPLHSEFLTADEGFYAGVNFALGVACHVLSDPFGDPSLLIEYEAKETREWLAVIAKDAEELYDREHGKDADEQPLPIAARPPLELLERRYLCAGCAA